jgi:chromosome segregation ATPase
MAKDGDGPEGEKDAATLLVKIALLEEQNQEIENKLLHAEKDLQSTQALLEQQRAFSDGRETEIGARERELLAKLKRVENEAEESIKTTRADAAAQVERASQQAAEAEAKLHEQADASAAEQERAQAALRAADERAERLSTQLAELTSEKEALERSLGDTANTSESRLREVEERGAAAVAALETNLAELSEKHQRLVAEHSLASELENKLQAEVARLRSEARTREDAHRANQEEAEALKQEARMAREAEQKLASELAKARRELDELQRTRVEEMLRLEENLKEATRRVEDGEAAHEEAERALKTQLESASSRADSAADKVATLQTQVDALEAQLQAQSSSHSSSTLQVEDEIRSRERRAVEACEAKWKLTLASFEAGAEKVRHALEDELKVYKKQVESLDAQAKEEAVEKADLDEAVHDLEKAHPRPLPASPLRTQHC